MRAFLVDRPWWVLSLVFGTLFGTWTGFYSWLTEHDTPVTTLTGAAIAGTLFGALMGPWAARASRREAASVGPVRTADRALVDRAAWRGPVPTDPAVRSAAARTASHRLDVALGQRRFGIILFSVATVTSLMVATFSSPWWLLATGVFAALLVSQWLVPHRLRKRLALLTA